MNPKIAILIAALLAGLALPANAKLTQLSGADRALLENASQFQPLHSTKEIPSEVLAACAVFAKEINFPLAEPGKPFQSTDMMDSRKLPTRRLIWAAKGPGCYVIYYEHGGIGLSEHILLVKLGAGKNGARVAWSTSDAGMTYLKDYAAFVKALKGDKLGDDPKFRGF